MGKKKNGPNERTPQHIPTLKCKKASLRSVSKPVHALPSCTNSIKHAFPSVFQQDPSLTPSTSYTHRQTNEPMPSQGLEVQPQTRRKKLKQTLAKNSPNRTHQTSPHPTNGAVFSIPSWTAFTFAVLACTMFVAARVTRPLVTPGAHPAVFTSTGARHTNAMATTVRCTNLCGRQGHRKKKRQKEESGGRQTGRGGC